MHLHDALLRGEAGRQRIGSTLRRDLDGQVADFAAAEAVDRLAEGARDQLGAEADAEDRLALGMEAADEREQRGKGRIADVVARMHGSAENDQAVEASGAALQWLAAMGEDGREQRALRLRDRADDAGRRDRAALHDQQPRRTAGRVFGRGVERDRAPRAASYNHLKSLRGTGLPMRPADPKKDA